MSANGQSLELAQCEQAHSSSTGPAVTFWVFRGDPAAMGGKIFINYRRDDSIGIGGRPHDPLAPAFCPGQTLFGVGPPPARAALLGAPNTPRGGGGVVFVVIRPPRRGGEG